MKISVDSLCWSVDCIKACCEIVWDFDAQPSEMNDFPDSKQSLKGPIK